LEKRIWEIKKIRAIANYQFESDVGRILFPDEVELTYSRRTGRIRHIFLEGQLLATLRPRDSLFSLTIYGAERLKAVLKPLQSRVVAMKEVEEVIRSGRNLFARHVVTADEEVRPGSEVMITTRDDDLLAVGKAVLSGREMLAFKRGVAVKVRRGIEEVEGR
jgi:predicted RNA-binding protein (TIGR00451 family)